MNLDLGNIDLNIHVIRIAVREQHDQAPTAGRRTHRPMADIKQDCIPELCQVEVAGSVV